MYGFDVCLCLGPSHACTLSLASALSLSLYLSLWFVEPAKSKRWNHRSPCRSQSHRRPGHRYRRQTRRAHRRRRHRRPCGTWLAPPPSRWDWCSARWAARAAWWSRFASTMSGLRVVVVVEHRIWWNGDERFVCGWEIWYILVESFTKCVLCGDTASRNTRFKGW